MICGDQSLLGWKIFYQGIICYEWNFLFTYKFVYTSKLYFLSNILEIFNAEVLFRDDCTSDEFVDVILGSRVYMPCLYVSKYRNYILIIISCVNIF